MKTNDFWAISCRIIQLHVVLFTVCSSKAKVIVMFMMLVYSFFFNLLVSKLGPFWVFSVPSFALNLLDVKLIKDGGNAFPPLYCYITVTEQKLRSGFFTHLHPRKQTCDSEDVLQTNCCKQSNNNKIEQQTGLLFFNSCTSNTQTTGQFRLLNFRQFCGVYTSLAADIKGHARQ